MFKKILVANRGEIAVRIMRTCREMGIVTVAVYSDIDRKSPFVFFADEAYALGGVTSRESYLNIPGIVELAERSGAEAIHPGYGFLSENPVFSEEVEKAGLTFIGPSSGSMRLMGSKTAARALMIRHGVPVVPGTEAAITDTDDVRLIARNLGYPVLIKAAAGGGGKGMRRVDDEQSLAEAMESARREAKAAFGDESVYIEKYLEEPRHIEFQILADRHGNTVHLGERECSVQRRHQKIIEEAPSSVLSPELRSRMGQSAIKAVQACSYVNAGTVEFLLDKNRNYYFLEMNTRLQVEHPVTELVTGLDLVREQINIAAGEALSVKNNLESFWGHAIECRLYAEDPEENFAPSPGEISYLKAADGPGIREDSGVHQGSEISLYYDPMISKLIAWGIDREQAIARMKRALHEYELYGIKTTIPFLLRILDHPDFRSGHLSTHFIDRHREELFMENSEKAELAGMISVIHFMENENITDRIDSPLRDCAKQWKMIRRKNNLGGT